MITQINNEEAIKFLRSNKKKEDYIFVRNNDIWYVYQENNKILSIIGIKIKNDFIKIGSSLTLKNERKNGISTLLRQEIIKDFNNISIISYSNVDSKNINKKLGFKFIRSLKNGTELLKYENYKKIIIL